jgi:hypothetical protein
MKKVVNGVEVEMAPEEEAEIRAEWAASCTLEIRRARQWERIKAERDRRTVTGGYKVAVAGVDQWFHSDTFSRTQQLGLVMLGAAVPAVQWKTMDGSFVAMTQQLAGQIFAAAAASDVALFAHGQALRAQVDVAEDPDAMDITAGWPAVYGE